ncbi:MAG: tyrosine-type recombinase/integrase [Gammaproteobacteria bacterium]
MSTAASSNPRHGALACARRRANKTGQTRHYPALRRDELGAFQRKLVEYPGRPETRLALQLLLLSFVRPGELRAARWTEFDLEAAEWRIPAARMRGRADHIVPLSRQAVAALEELRTLTGHGEYLFPGGHKRVPYMSENTINKAIAVLGYKGRIVGHGFRATASTILNEAGRFPVDAVERQLAHAERNKVRAAYHRAEYLRERRVMMQEWADLLDGLRQGGEVRQFQRRG